MRLIKILLPIDMNGTTEACARVGFEIAERFDADLEVLLPCLPPMQRLPYATELSPIYFKELADAGRKQVELEQRQGRRWFKTAVQSFPNAKAELLITEGVASSTAALRAKVSDLTVLPSIAAKDDEFWYAVRDAALFRSGRPVFIVPDEISDCPSETVVVAWKGVVEAVRAVSAAWPFLLAAKRVRLVSIREDGEDDSAPAMADYLRKAGISVDDVALEKDTREVGDMLLDAAGSGVVLVMGAYGHWRWREWAFGGATLHVLRNADIPVLMIH